MEKVLHEFQFTGMDGERECVCREVGSLLDAKFWQVGGCGHVPFDSHNPMSLDSSFLALPWGLT